MRFAWTAATTPAALPPYTTTSKRSGEGGAATAEAPRPQQEGQDEGGRASCAEDTSRVV